MDFLIKRMCAIAAVAVFSGSAIPAPAFAQSSTSGVLPIVITGDQSPEKIADTCGIAAADIRGQVVLNSPGMGTSGEFSVTVTPSGTDRIAFTDTSSPDQFNGTVGVEAVGVRRNGTNVFCFADQISDGSMDAPGSGAPNQITIIWGPGPCPFTDAELAPICTAYQGLDPEAEVFVQGHVLGANQPVNMCGCGEVEALFCDEGTVGSCIPAGESSEFTGSEFTGSSTVGTGTCEQVTTTIGGRVRTVTVCN